MKVFFTKKKGLQKFWSSRTMQWFIRLLAFGWCFIRKNDRRFVGTSSMFAYDGDPTVPAEKHRRGRWDTWVCVQIPEQYRGETHVVFDIYTGQRLALLGKTFRGGELVAFRVGAESAYVGLVSCDQVIMHYPPRFIGRWNIPSKGHRHPDFWVDGVRHKINYI